MVHPNFEDRDGNGEGVLGRSVSSGSVSETFRFDTDEVRIRKAWRRNYLGTDRADWDWLHALVGPVDDDLAKCIGRRTLHAIAARARILRVKYALDTQCAHRASARNTTLHPARSEMHAPQFRDLINRAARTLLPAPTRAHASTKMSLASSPCESRCPPSIRRTRGKPERYDPLLLASESRSGPTMRSFRPGKSQSLTLIAHNVGEFSRVAGLRVDDREG